MSIIKTKIAYSNLEKAFNSLQEFLIEPILTKRDRAGVIQAFEYTYEQFWKTFKKIAEAEQLEAHSPRQAIQAAFSLKVIETQDEPIWIEIIKIRNETSHTYNEDQAIQAVEKIQKKFLPAFLRAWSQIQALSDW